MCSHPSSTLPRPAVEIEVKLEPTPLAPSEARRFVARELEVLGYAELIEDARLMVSELVTLMEESPVLALVKNDDSPPWCHRHLARGEQIIAVHTKVWIELDVIVTTPDLCQRCLDDLDSWEYSEVLARP
jgi:hypothetical protein